MSATNSSSTVEFEALLLRLGFTKAVVDFLSDEQGIKIVDDLKIIPMTQMTSTYSLSGSAVAAYNIRRIQMARGFTVAVSGTGSTQASASSVLVSDMVVLPMSPWTKLCGFRTWMDYRDLREESLEPQKFVSNLIATWVDRYNFLKSEADSKIKPLDAPKLTSITGWEAFCDAFDLTMSYYRTMIGGIPLNFLLCDHVVATVEQLLTAYADIDTDLSVTAAHKGEVYREANKLLYWLLQPLIGDSMLHLIRKYQNTMDGCSVLEGKHVVIAKAHAAYKAIANAKFTGKHKSTNFATYSKIFHTAFNHLQEVGQDMSEVQKIKVFCDGIDC
jgi:hypothetical protein